MKDDLCRERKIYTVKFTMIVLKYLNIKLFIKNFNKIFFLSSHHPFFPLTGIISDGNIISGLKSWKQNFRFYVIKDVKNTFYHCFLCSQPSVSVGTLSHYMRKISSTKKISKRQGIHFSSIFLGDLNKTYTMARITDLANT